MLVTRSHVLKPWTTAEADPPSLTRKNIQWKFTVRTWLNGCIYSCRQLQPHSKVPLYSVRKSYLVSLVLIYHARWVERMRSLRTEGLLQTSHSAHQKMIQSTKQLHRQVQERRTENSKILKCISIGDFSRILTCQSSWNIKCSASVNQGKKSPDIMSYLDRNTSF